MSAYETVTEELAREPRAWLVTDESYLVIILLSRVIIKLGALEHINPKVIEGFFSADLAFLQDFYRQINENHAEATRVVCPQCQHEFQVESLQPGG